jgi:hypothetical protein
MARNGRRLMTVTTIRRDGSGGLITYSGVPAGHCHVSRAIAPADASSWSDLRPCTPAHQLLYRLKDASAGLLYVGVTWTPKERWTRHRKTKRWWPDVASADVECHTSEDVAHAAEYLAITTEHPRHNRHGVRR